VKGNMALGVSVSRSRGGLGRSTIIAASLVGICSGAIGERAAATAFAAEFASSGGDSSSYESQQDPLLLDSDVCTNDACGPSGTYTHSFDTSNGASRDVDSDGDGLPDSIDPCVSIPEQNIDSARLDVRRINKDQTPGNDSLHLKGEFLFPTKAKDLDPAATGARILIYSNTLALLSDVMIPPGAPWSADVELVGGGLISEGKWVFRDPTGAHSGIRRFRIREFSPYALNGVYIRVVGKRGTYPVAEADVPIRVTVIIGDGQAANCADVTFEAGNCTFGPHGRRLKCR